MLISNKKWTYQEYLQLNDGQRYELLNGELIMTPAPSFEHQDLSAKIVNIFTNFVNNKKLGKVLFAPFDVILDENTVVQPDIIFIGNQNIKLIEKRGLFGAPDLVVEIISPTSIKRDLEDKRHIYEKFGVKEYWIVFPSEKAIEVLVLNNNKYQVLEFASQENELPLNLVKSKIFENLEINLNDLFE